METFESIYVGSFIFTLGYLAKAAGLDLSQQVAGALCRDNGDQLVADIVSAWQGRNFIIEFRRNEERVRHEFHRPYKRALLDVLNSVEGVALRRSSRRGHFIAYGMAARKIGGLVFMRYFEATDTPTQTGSHVGLAPFFDGVITNRNAGLDAHEFRLYVGQTTRICRSATAEECDGGVVTLPALILNYDPAAKSMKFAFADLMRFLELPLESPAARRPHKVLS